VLKFVLKAEERREKSAVFGIRRIRATQAICLSLSVRCYVVDPLKFVIYFDVNFARELWLFVMTVREPGADQVAVLVKRMLYFKTKLKLCHMVYNNTLRQG
jgi:hypothetical protein